MSMIAFHIAPTACMVLRLGNTNLNDGSPRFRLLSSYMEPKHWSLFSRDKALFVPSPKTQAGPLKIAGTIRALVISMSFIALIILSGCSQTVPSPKSANSPSMPPTQRQVVTSEPAAESAETTPIETSDPTYAITITGDLSPTQLPHIGPIPQLTYTPGPNPTATPPTAKRGPSQWHQMVTSTLQTIPTNLFRSSRRGRRG